jgi:hypothetical protein
MTSSNTWHVWETATTGLDPQDLILLIEYQESERTFTIKTINAFSRIVGEEKELNSSQLVMEILERLSFPLYFSVISLTGKETAKKRMSIERVVSYIINATTLIKATRMRDSLSPTGVTPFKPEKLSDASGSVSGRSITPFPRGMFRETDIKGSVHTSDMMDAYISALSDVLDLTILKDKEK